MSWVFPVLWFFPGAAVSSTNKTDHHDIAEILLKVALNTITPTACFAASTMNIIFNDNVRILCLSCNVKKVGKIVIFKQKGQKQASILAFHKCFQGCLLRGPLYISISFILVSALCCT
jgi:hypothetical protein